MCFIAALLHFFLSSLRPVCACSFFSGTCEKKKKYGSSEKYTSEKFVSLLKRINKYVNNAHILVWLATVIVICQLIHRNVFFAICRCRRRHSDFCLLPIAFFPFACKKSAATKHYFIFYRSFNHMNRTCIINSFSVIFFFIVYNFRQQKKIKW